MGRGKTQWLLVGLLVLALWPVAASGQGKVLKSLWPFGRNPARLELVEAVRIFAPKETIQVRLTNVGETPLYIITEVHRRVRTAQGRRLPGLPVYERRRQKFFFRSDRWVYRTNERARFRAAALEPGDSITFPVHFSRPSRYKVHLGYWRDKDIGDRKAFLKMDVQEIEKRYNRKVRWISSQSFRIRAPKAAPQPKKKNQ